MHWMKPEGTQMNLFGTDGIRGIANADLTCEIAFKLGQAVGLRLTPPRQVCVGRDTRVSGNMLEAALIAGSPLQAGM